MDELLKAWTRAGNAVAAYFEKAVQPSLPGLDSPPAAEPKPRKKRTAADGPEAGAAAAAPAAIPPTPPAAPAAQPPAGAAVVEQSEEESLKEVRALAKTFVQRFQNQVDGIKAFRELIAATTGVARIDDLVHAQRLSVIAKAKMEIAQKDAPKVAAPQHETAGTAV